MSDHIQKKLKNVLSQSQLNQKKPRYKISICVHKQINKKYIYYIIEESPQKKVQKH